MYLQIIPVQTYHLLPLIVKSQISSFPFFSLLIIVFSFFFTFAFELLVLFIYTFSSCIDILFIVKIEKIIAEVAKTYNVSENDILSNRRTQALALARQVAMYIARETTDLSYKAIGESFGKDHTTVLYNVNRIEEFLKDKPYEKELVDDIIKNLTSENSGY